MACVAWQGWVRLSGGSVAGVEFSCLQKKLKKLIWLLSEMTDSLMLKGNWKRVVMIIKLLTQCRI